VTRKLNKILPNVWERVAEKAKISTSEFNLKAQNIRIKLVLKPYNKPQDQCELIGQNFAILVTYYATNFHPNKQFQPVVCRKVSKVV
jgi:hypothetical protein